MEWSLWDRWVLEGDLTVQQVIDWFKVCPRDKSCVLFSLSTATSTCPAGAHPVIVLVTLGGNTKVGNVRLYSKQCPYSADCSRVQVPADTCLEGPPMRVTANTLVFAVCSFFIIFYTS